MSWANIKELIFQERKTLDPGIVFEMPAESAFETQHSALLGNYLKTKSQVDAAITAFSERLDWPELTALEKFFVVARLDFAWEVVSILNTSRDREPLIHYPSPDRCTTPELLQWLLIDIWPYGCGRFLQAQRWVAEQISTEHRLETRPVGVMANAKCVA
jgi:hypothetical protein